MNAFKNNMKNILWRYHLTHGMTTLDKKNPFARKISIALKETIHNNREPEEDKWINKIEQIRSKFENNKKAFSIIDFGAGEPDSARSEEEMEKGVLQTATYAEVCATCKPPLWSLILFKLIRQFKPQIGIEMGTGIGISAAYQAAAQVLNGAGKLITMEGSESIVDLAKQNFVNLNLNNISVVTGKFSDTLETVLKENHQIDYVFVDGHHDEEATWKYFQQILPYLSPNALIVFDDISWSDGMKRVWDKIKEDENCIISVDLKMMGVCVTSPQSR